MLKFEEDDVLKIYQHHLLYSKKKLNYQPVKIDKVIILQMMLMQAEEHDNPDNRIDKFADQLQTEFYYRIPLRFLCSLDLVNQPVKFNTKWLLSFETHYQRLFESKANQANDALPNNVDAKTFLTSTPYIMYQQFKLDDNYRIYFEGIMISNNLLRTGIQSTPYQKSYEMVHRSQSITVIFEAFFSRIFAALRLN